MPKVLHFGGPRKGTAIKAFIATPCAGDVNPAFAYGLFTSALQMDVDVDLEIYTENCHVDDGRNRLVRDFLETDCTDLVFIDADVKWNPSDLIKLIKYDRDVVAGIYPLKQEEEGYPVRHLPGEIWSDKDGLIEVDGVPTGFLKIKRGVLEELAKDADIFPSKDDWKGRKMIPIIFERTHSDNTRWGGDYTFCKKWRDKGGKIFIDPNFKLEHYGGRCWSGTYANYLRQNMGLGMKPYLDAFKEGSETTEHLISMVEQWGNGYYSGSPEFVYACAKYAREAAGNILECGTGLTTLVMASVTDQTIYSLEHDPVWASHISKEIDRYGIKNVKIIYAPIKDKWYSVGELPEFDMVVCDGPPRKYNSRTEVFKMNIKEGSPVLWDDYETGLRGDISVHGASRRFAVLKYQKRKVA